MPVLRMTARRRRTTVGTRILYCHTSRDLQDKEIKNRETTMEASKKALTRD